MQHTFLSRFGRIVPIASAAVVSMTLSAQMAAPPQAAGPLRQGAAQTSAQQPQIQAASLNAEFTKGIDTKKAKTGDEVNAKTTADARLPDGTDLPKGTRLVGNVVEVTPKSKERKNSHLVFSLNRRHEGRQGSPDSRRGNVRDRTGDGPVVGHALSQFRRYDAVKQ